MLWLGVGALPAPPRWGCQSGGGGAQRAPPQQHQSSDCHPFLVLLCHHRGLSPHQGCPPSSLGTARPPPSRSGQIHIRLFVKLMVIPADTKGKRRRIFLLWMDESKNPQPAMAAFNIPDLHTMCSGKTGPQSWMLQQLISVLTIKKISQRLQFPSFVSVWAVRIFREGY